MIRSSFKVIKVYSVLEPFITSESMFVYFHKQTENHTRSCQFFLFPASNSSTLGAVICHWCQGLEEGRKKERKHQPQTGLQLLCCSFCPLCTFINLSCPGRLFISELKCHIIISFNSVQDAISFGKNINMICQRT